MQSRLKLATYNVHRCFGTDGKFSPQRITRVIKQLDADIVALQEVETFTDGGSNILETFETELRFTAIPGPTMYRVDSSYGNAVLSRRPPINVDNHDISVPGVEPRGVISLCYIINGLKIHIAVTHLGLKAGERLQQINAISHIMQQHPADISVLMGDINEWLPWSRTARWLDKQFGNSSTPATFPSRLPMFPLDQIRAWPNKRIDTTKKLVTPLTKTASDHLPLTATLWL